MGSMSQSTSAAGFRRADSTERALVPACTRHPAMAAGPVAFGITPTPANPGRSAHPRAWVQLRKGPAAARGSKSTVRSPTGPHRPAGPTLRPGALGYAGHRSPIPGGFDLYMNTLSLTRSLQVSGSTDVDAQPRP